MPKDRKLDLFELLRKITSKDYGYFDTLTDEQIKEFQPFVIMRWLSGITDSGDAGAYQLMRLDHLVNRSVFTLGEHKKLIYWLMCISCLVSPRTRYSYPKRVKSKKQSLSLDVIMEYYNEGLSKAMDILALLNKDDVVQLAKELGWQDKEIKELRKEFNKK